jgi:glutamyl-tRNA(Gln) amidotransferase subunit E
MSFDYEAIGLKCGIEIHQQLDTSKLFCNCPSIVSEGKPDFMVERELRAVAGETGRKDVAALHEEMKQKHFIYEVFNESACLIDLDEEPPRNMNEDSLEIVLKVASVLDAKIVDEIQVMRKTVIDGSNTTGFQRTALVARNGKIETSKGKVNIPTISIEEESARIISQDADSVRYGLDRLGIPLIEIGTAAEIKDPEHCKETAEKLGMILRSVGGVKRGLGTIRQDINISIRKGARIELKGAQDLKLIPKYVEFECLRQINLLGIKDELKGASIIEEKTDVTKLLETSSSKVIQKALSSNGVVLALKLPGFKGFIGKEIQPGRRLGTEFSDYAKVRAGVHGLFHSDELPNYGITQEETDLMHNSLGLSLNDAFILVADSEDKASRALDAVIERARLCFIEIPKEVRKANDDGTSSYMRPLPGAARLYPETDVLPIKANLKEKFEIEMIDEKAKRFADSYKISFDLASMIAKGNFDFDGLVKKFAEVNPAFIAGFLVSIPKDLKRRHNVDVDSLKFADEVLGKLNNQDIPKQAIPEILLELASGKNIDYSKYGVDTSQAEMIVEEVVSKNKGASFQALMGIAMKELRGKLDGKKVAELVMKFMA